jgi:hypothetical protein
MSIGSIFSLLFWLIVVIALGDPPGWVLVGGAVLALLAGAVVGFLESSADWPGGARRDGDT